MSEVCNHYSRLVDINRQNRTLTIESEIDEDVNQLYMYDISQDLDCDKLSDFRDEVVELTLLLNRKTKRYQVKSVCYGTPVNE